MPEPLVSVKMITYNHAPFIVQAIEGVLQQKTNFSIELVIGEDCSTDGTREIVFEYEKRYPDIIRVITSDRNVGAGKNSRRTTKACRGKYVAFCEGDDYWHHPDKLQRQADYLEGHPDCGLVYSDYDVYHTESKKLIKEFIKYRKAEVPKHPDISEFFVGRGAMKIAILTCTVMVRRALSEQVVEADPYLYRGDQFLRGDTQLWAEISTRDRLHYIPESLATHNILVESAISSKNIKKLLRLYIADAKLGLYICDKYNFPSSARDELERNWCHYSLELAFQSRSAELAREVRQRKKRFSWKDWLRYYGARNVAVHYVYRLATQVRGLFRKEYRQWM